MTTADQQNECTVEGVDYVAVHGYSCDECDFNKTGCSPDDAPPCSMILRLDNRAIVWKKKGEF